MDSLPGFTAEAALDTQTFRQAFTAKSHLQDSRVAPALWPLDPPELNMSWQPRHPDPGRLAISGDSFAPDSDVLLTINNCDAFPLRTMVHTSKGSDPSRRCPDPRFCGIGVGGTFSTTIPCWCGGLATVSAQGQYGETTQSIASIDC